MRALGARSTTRRPRPLAASRCYARHVSESQATSRELIWGAATELFPRQGYSGTTVRDIATLAGVDPALVIRHFGTKESLFISTMSAVLDGQSVLSGPAETLGVDLIHFMFDAGDEVRGVFLALVRASDADAIGPRLREYHETTFVEPLRARLTGDDAELRARLAAALVGGLLYALWIVEDDALLAAGREQIVDHYAPLLQQLITPARA
jgi:AcrR family transcriptional regulator